MTFKYKSDAELQAMTAAERDAYATEKRKFEAEATKTQIDEALEKFKAENPVPDVTAMKNEITELREQLKQLKEEGNPTTIDARQGLVKQIKEKKDELKAMLKGVPDGKEIALKAVTTRASIATNVHQLLLDGIGQIARVSRKFYDICRKIPVSMGNHSGTIAYVDWDEATIVKAAAAVAEGSAFAESTAAFKGYTLPLRKIGDTLPVTEEFFEDEELAAGELEAFIEANVESKIDDQLINGDNTGQNLKGLLTTIGAYTAAASGITGANVFDLIQKMMESITKTGGSKYNPDFALMNKTTINRLVLAKDTTNNYLFPPNHPIYSLVVEDNSVPDNNLVVGDSRYARIYEMGGVTVSRGLSGTNFVEDKVTIKARKRLAFLIRQADLGGFKKVTNITTALATLAT